MKIMSFLLFEGYYRFCEFNSFEGSGRTETLELVFADGKFSGTLQQSDRYDTTENFPRSFTIQGLYNPDRDMLELEYKEKNETVRFLFKLENGSYFGNYPGHDDLWGEWEKIK